MNHSVTIGGSDNAPLFDAQQNVYNPSSERLNISTLHETDSLDTSDIVGRKISTYQKIDADKSDHKFLGEQDTEISNTVCQDHISSLSEDKVGDHKSSDYVDDQQVAINKLDDTWKEYCAEILQDKNEKTLAYGHLQIFLDGINRRSEAQHRIEETYEHVEKSLTDSAQQALAIAVPIYDELSSTLRNTEQDLICHFVRNHNKRQKLVHCLSSFDTSWKGTYSRLMQSVVNKCSNDVSSMEEKEEARNETKNELEVKCDGEEEPNWNILIESEHSSEGILSFLEGRERWQEACQNFSNALDEMHDHLRSTNGNILQAIASAFDIIMNEELEEQKQEIQECMVSNFQRRDYLENALEEAAKQQQGLFAKLMARVTGNTKK